LFRQINLDTVFLLSLSFISKENLCSEFFTLQKFRTEVLFAGIITVITYEPEDKLCSNCPKAMSFMIQVN